MSIQHNQSYSVNTDGSNPISGTAVELGATEHSVDVTIAAATSNQSVAISFTASTVQSVILLSSVNMTLKTNSTSVPDNTINLVAGIPLVWSKSAGYFSNPFTANVTVFYLTTTPAGRFRAKVLTS